MRRAALPALGMQELVHTQQFYNWQHWRKRGQDALEAAGDGKGGG